MTVDESSRAGRAYEAYGWIILSASVALSLLGAVLLMFPADPAHRDPEVLWVIRAWGMTWVGFNLLALVFILIPFRRGERWAWYTLWILPLLWLALFALAPELPLYVVLGILTATGLILPYRWFFPRREGVPRRVR